MILFTQGWAAEARLRDARHALTAQANPETEKHFALTLRKVEEALVQLSKDLASVPSPQEEKQS
jgi:hypothetical protein